jgi:FliI/YscN family ATPase
MVSPLLSLEKYVRAAERSRPHAPSGTVIEVVGLVVEVGGLEAGVGDLVEVEGAEKPLSLEVIGFRSGRLLATALGPVTGIRPGARVVHASRGTAIPVGDALLGRILDPFGVPIDGKEAPPFVDRYPAMAPPPPAMSRRTIERVFGTGARAIDALLTLGRGQRVGIFAGAGVGKTTLLGMICRASVADVNVVGLIGERGREVNEFLRDALGPEGLARSVVVVATSDQPPLVRARGAESATAIAEYFRDQGKSVLLVMDSVTRYAMSLREAALATGEPPATKGYPPSVFAALPRLLERAGTGSGEGTITALYTVLVEGDDLSDPIADTVRGILDGHIVLSRSLAERGHFPAIDVLQSISRLAPILMPKSQMRAASTLRDWMSAYREAADLVQVGAYVPGSDPRVDMAMRKMPHIDAFLRQDAHEPAPFEATLGRLHELTGVPR